MPLPIQASFRNRLLAVLPPEDRAFLCPYLDHVDLPLKKVLFACGEPITHIYFPEAGLGSVTANLGDGAIVEVGLVGSEGMVGLPIVLGATTSSNECLIQIAGHGHSLRAATLRVAMEQSPALTALLLRYAQAFHGQVAQTAACNARHHIEERLARWLLMCHDRCEGDRLPLTHEFLAIMLGVRRSGVTVAAGALQRGGIITYERGCIIVLDRPGLESTACECYRTVRQQFEELLG
jgi:CRP-like cAMP-binding protein